MVRRSCLLAVEEADGVFPWPGERGVFYVGEADDVASAPGARRRVISAVMRLQVELRPIAIALKVRFGLRGFVLRLVKVLVLLNRSSWPFAKAFSEAINKMQEP